MLRMPLSQSSRPGAPKSSRGPPGDGAPKAIHGQRIMIVEDEALVAMILEDQLEELGLSIVATCANVTEAMKAIDKNTPDAAILDVNLGGSSFIRSPIGSSIAESRSCSSPDMAGKASIGATIRSRSWKSRWSGRRWKMCL